MDNKRLTSFFIGFALLLALGACGNPDRPDLDAGGRGGGSDGDVSLGQCVIPGSEGEGSTPAPVTPEDCDDMVVGPEEPVSDDGDHSTVEPAPGPSPVEPQPGQENVRPIGWDKARIDSGGRSVDIVFWSGVEPCYVLDHVEVEYRAEKVVITLFQGSTPSDEEVACIDIAVRKVTTVELDEPLGDREVVDGTRP